MDTRAYLRVLWLRKWIIILAALAAVTVSIVGVFSMTPIYAATATLRLPTPGQGASPYVSYNLNFADRIVQTFTQIATSSATLEQVRDELGLENLPTVEVSHLSGSELVTITAEHPDAETAAAIANTLAALMTAQSSSLYSGGMPTASEMMRNRLDELAQELAAYRQDYTALLDSPTASESELDALRSTIELNEGLYASLLSRYEEIQITDLMLAQAVLIVEAAQVPPGPSKPNKMLYVSLGGAIGVIGGLALALLVENLDTKLHTTQAISAATALPLLAQIPEARPWQRRSALYLRYPYSEAFRGLRHRLDRCLQQDNARILMITSTQPGEGKSTIAANLAHSFAQLDRKVLLVDADLRRPRIHQLFGLDNTRGLSNILMNSTNWDNTLQKGHSANVEILTSGAAPPDPAKQLCSTQMARLLDELRGKADIILIDTPAFLPVPDAEVLLSYVDGVLLVVGRGRARESALGEALHQLDTRQANIIGVVVNRAEHKRSYTYYSYRERSSGQAETNSSAK